MGGKNSFMTKIFDLISVGVIIAFLSFVWAGLILEDVALSIVISIAITCGFFVIAHAITTREEKPYAYDRLALELSVRGPSFLVENLKTILKNHTFESGFNYISIKNVLFYVNFKFGNVTINDLPNLYSTAQKCEKKQVFLFARGIERKALRLLETYGIYITVVKIKPIYKLLKKHNLLPDLKKKRTFRLQDLPVIFISKSNFKGLIFSGVILLSTAFFTPLKIYYLIFGSIALLLAIISLSPLGKDTPSQKQNIKEFFAGLSTNVPLEKNADSLEIDEPDKKNDDGI